MPQCLPQRGPQVQASVHAGGAHAQHILSEKPGGTACNARGGSGEIQHVLGGDSVVKNPPGRAGGARDSGLIPGSGRPPGVRNGNSPQHSCLENPIDRRAQGTAV